MIRNLWHYIAGMIAGCGAGTIGSNLAHRGPSSLTLAGGVLLVLGMAVSMAMTFMEQRRQRPPSVPASNPVQG